MTTIESTSTASTALTVASTSEYRELMETLDKHRSLFRFTVQGITDQQARLRTTASELTLGGLIKHVTAVEAQWQHFIEVGTAAVAISESDWAQWADNFTMLADETLGGLLGRYEEVAARTAEIAAGLPDLDVSHPLPEAPWFEKGASWSARRVLLHIIAETAQHAGHADIIRESIDGQKSMG